MRIHAMDIIQSPGICMAPVDDIDIDQTTVRATQTANSVRVPIRNARSDAACDMSDARLSCIAPLSAFAVLIVTAPPNPLLITALGRTIQPLIHAPQTV